MERYVIHTDNETVEKTFGVNTSSQSIFDPNFNAASGHSLPVIFKEKGVSTIQSKIWGITKGKQTISSVEISEVLQDEYYLDLLKSKPCIIPVTGFYKWKQTVDDPLPFFVRIHTRDILAIAGFYLENESGRNSFCVITMEASVLLKPLENSMPCILSPGKFESWLNGGAVGLLKEGFKDTSLLPDMTVVRVPDLVNDLSNNHKDLIQPIPKLRDED